MGIHELEYGKLKPLLFGLPAPSGPPTGRMLFRDKDEGTRNFRAMAYASNLLSAVQFNDPPDLDDALSLVEGLFAEEKVEGLWGHEQTTPDSHAVFELGAEIGFRRAGLLLKEKLSSSGVGGRAVDKVDGARADKLLMESTLRLTQLRHIYSLVSTPDGEVFSPGTRAGSHHNGRDFKNPPFSQVATGFYRLLSKLPHLGPAATVKWWSDGSYGLILKPLIDMLYDPGIKFLQKRPREFDGPDKELIEALRLTATNTTNPPPTVNLRLPMHVRRSSTGFVAWLDGRKEQEPIVDWVRCEFGPPRKHKVTFGHNWEETPDRSPLGGKETQTNIT